MLQGGYVLYPTRAARVLVKGAAARCRVQLLEWRVRSGAGWWCRCRVLLQGAAVKVVCVRFGVGMLVPLQELQGAVVGFFSEAAGGVV